MEIIKNFQNLDLLSVGLAIAAIGILGFIVYDNNRRSITNRTFSVFALLTIVYGIFNYLNYQVSSPVWILWLLRLTLFSAVWHAFSLFQLFLIFPREKVNFPKWYFTFLLPVVGLTALATLSPWVFSRIDQVAQVGQVTNPERGPGIILFGLVVLGLVGGGIYHLFKNTVKAAGMEKKQSQFILIGTIITFSLIIVFNFILPVIFNNLRFIPLAPVFFLPFIAFTAYAIIKYRLLSIKVVAAEMLSFALAAVTLFDVVVSDDIGVLLLRVGVFSLVLGFGILLTRSVLKEVEQREKLEVLTKELEKANGKLKELDRLKSEFLSFASHQVKAPMAVVKGFATLIYDGTYGPASDQIKETARKIKDSADRMIVLVNNILNLRKIEEGKMEYHFENADVVSLARQMLEELKPLADNKGLALTLETSLTGATCKIDVEKFRQVLQNLIENAIKYTLEGWVKVILEKNGRFLLVKISDSGRGLSVELLPRLFERFSRDEMAAKGIEGTGLGLYIAKQVVLAHQGEIWAESPGEGQGSTFTVKIPLIGS